MTYFEELSNSRIKHAENMASAISSKVLQIRKENIKQSLSDYGILGHRKEYVTTIDEVMYFDDAKAENVNATWFTFESTTKPIVWIACGSNDNIDYTDLLLMAKQNVKALICLGDKKGNLKNAFENSIHEIYDAKDMDEAVRMASIVAQDDDIVVFSPASKSAKQNETFEERGNQFRNSVKQIENEWHQ